MIAGGCYCGAVRYEAAGTPFHRTICHCSICRGTTGAPMVAWFSVARDALRFTRGTPVSFASTPEGTRTFCGTCGSQLTFASARFPDEIDVTTCTLDDAAAMPPEDHTYARSRLPWGVLDDGLPRHLTTRDAGG